KGFLIHPEGSGINLRNFKIQVAKYATLSDIFVYGENGVDDNVMEVAKQIAWAQKLFRKDKPNLMEYEVFVIVDPFSYFEEEYPELVSIDSKGVIRNKINFLDREREEMKILTSASEISTNVWLGNTQDVPISSDLDPADSAISLIDDNPHQFCVCIESHDLAEMPDETTLCFAAGQLSLLSKSFTTDDIIHLDCISSR
ncbi:19689_t:CDS:2, partial [Dentiscutata erythropus]